MQRRLAWLHSRSSVVVDAPLRDVWKVCRAWGRQPWMPLLPDGTPFDVKVQGTASEVEVGAIRCSKMGPNVQLFEQLVAIDDQATIMKWKTIEHTDTVCPFEDASFSNFETTLSLHPVTMGNKTFVEWEGTCYTEPQFAASVQETMDVWLAGGMSSLKSYAAHQMAKKRLTEVHHRESNYRPQQAYSQADMRSRAYTGEAPYPHQGSQSNHPRHRPTY